MKHVHPEFRAADPELSWSVFFWLCLTALLYAGQSFAQDHAPLSGQSQPAAPVMPVAADSSVKQDTRLVTIEELMRLDAQTALRLARRNSLQDEAQSGSLRLAPSSRPAENATDRPASEPVVQAIYGIGRALKAEVLIGRDVHVLEPKSRQTVQPGGVSLVLEKIDPPCVQLKKDQQRETLCLGQVRP